MKALLSRLRWRHLGYVSAVVWAAADLPQAVMGTWHPDHVTQLAATYWALSGMWQFGRGR